MKILITGGSGFQGKHLARRLIASGHQVVVLTTTKVGRDQILGHDSKGDIEIIRGDIKDEELVHRAVEKVDTVYHLAGKVNPRDSIENPNKYFNTNVIGSYILLEAVRKYNKRLLFVSSCAVYGDGSGLSAGELFTEQSLLLPMDPYGASKVAIDRMCYAYHRSYNLNVTIIRPFTAYGPGQMIGVSAGLIPTITERAIKKEPLMVYGDGSAIRDFIYIDDLIDAYELLLDKGLPGEVYNVASGNETRVIDVVTYIAEYFGAEIAYVAANEFEVKRYAANIKKIKDIGFSTKTTLNEGLKNYLSSLDLDIKK